MIDVPNNASGLIFTEPSLRVWLPPLQNPAASQLGAVYVVALLLVLQRVCPSFHVFSLKKIPPAAIKKKL